MNPNFDGIVEIDYCPSCKSKNQIDSDGYFVTDRNDNFFMFSSCHVCKKIFMYEYNGKKPDETTVSGRLPFQKITLEFVYRYPSNDVSIYDSVSSDVKNSYLEGAKCINIDSPNAAVTMFRRTLQQVCKEKGANSGTLQNQINQIIPQELQAEAHELRLWGNLGAHPDDIVPSVSLVDAKQLQEFIERVLYALYEYPSKIRKTQDNRAK